MRQMEEKPEADHIPEEIREFVEKYHKQKRESRPDENWHMKTPDGAEHIAPYKQDEESAEAESDIPHFDEGGSVDDPVSHPEDLPGYDGPVAQTPQAPPAPTMANEQSIQPDMSDQDYASKAGKMLNVKPDQQASMLNLLGGNDRKSQLAAGIAGIGDAIASGGTLGKVNPNGLEKSENIIQNDFKNRMDVQKMARGNQKEDFEVGQQMRGNAPFSPAIQKSLVTQFKIPAALAGAPRDVINKMLDPIAQTQLKEAELAEQSSFKNAQLGFEKQQLEAQTQHQGAEEKAIEEQRELERNKAIAGGSSIPFVGPTRTQKQAALASLAGTAPKFTPDVMAYAQKHGITPEQAQEQKNRRMGPK